MHKLQHSLGARGKGGKIKADRVNVLRILSSIVVLVLFDAVEKSPGFSPNP